MKLIFVNYATTNRTIMNSSSRNIIKSKLSAILGPDFHYEHIDPTFNEIIHESDEPKNISFRLRGKRLCEIQSDDIIRAVNDQFPHYEFSLCRISGIGIYATLTTATMDDLLAEKRAIEAEFETNIARVNRKIASFPKEK